MRKNSGTTTDTPSCRRAPRGHSSAKRLHKDRSDRSAFVMIIGNIMQTWCRFAVHGIRVPYDVGDAMPTQRSHDLPLTLMTSILDGASALIRQTTCGVYAVRGSPLPSRTLISLRMRYFCTLPVTVIGKASTNTT